MYPDLQVVSWPSNLPRPDYNVSLQLEKPNHFTRFMSGRVRSREYGHHASNSGGFGIFRGTLHWVLTPQEYTLWQTWWYQVMWQGDTRLYRFKLGDATTTNNTNAPFVKWTNVYQATGNPEASLNGNLWDLKLPVVTEFPDLYAGNNPYSWTQDTSTWPDNVPEPQATLTENTEFLVANSSDLLGVPRRLLVGIALRHDVSLTITCTQLEMCSFLGWWTIASRGFTADLGLTVVTPNGVTSGILNYRFMSLPKLSGNGYFWDITIDAQVWASTASLLAPAIVNTLNPADPELRNSISPTDEEITNA